MQLTADLRHGKAAQNGHLGALIPKRLQKLANLGVIHMAFEIGEENIFSLCLAGGEGFNPGKIDLGLAENIDRIGE